MLDRITGDVKSQDAEVSPLPLCLHSTLLGFLGPGREQMGCPHLVAHEEAYGPRGLDPDANVAFRVGWQDVALLVDDLEQEACESHLRVTPTTPPHPNSA